MTPESAESKKKLLHRFKRRFLSQTFFENNKQRTPFRRSLAEQLVQHPPRLVLIGFALAIALGTLLLSLPQATASNDPLPFLDALFTATSATCVTGLIVVDTGTAFSTFGLIVILALIQVGGLGHRENEYRMLNFRISNIEFRTPHSGNDRRLLADG